MRVLYVDHTGLVSGAQWALLDLIEGLPSTVDPILMCPPGRLAELAVRRGARHVPIPGTAASLRLHPVHTTKALGDAIASVRMLRRVVGADVDLVHANSLRAGLIAGVARTPGGPPLVVHVHDALPAGRTADWIRRQVRRQADAVVVVSEYTRRNFTAGTPGWPIHVLFNPLDAVRFDPARVDGAQARARLGLPEQAPLIGLVAQITPWKGHDVAIRALAEVRRRHPEANLVIAGESKFIAPVTRYDNPAYERSLRTLIRELRLRDNVRFLGEVLEVEDLMAALDVAVAPSWEEPFGRSVAESMALEVFTIATEVGGPAEIIEDGVDGRLLDPRDVPAWARTISDALDDGPGRLDVGRRASVKVRQRFDRGDYVGRMLGVYAGVA